MRFVEDPGQAFAEDQLQVHATELRVGGHHHVQAALPRRDSVDVGLEFREATALPC